MLAIIGLVFIAIGAGIAAVAFVLSIASWWQDWAPNQLEKLREIAANASLGGSYGSWVWMVVAGVALVLIIVMIAWIANQGRGRTSVLFAEGVKNDLPTDNGKVTLGNLVAENALKAALSERHDVVSVSVTSYQFKGRTSLRVRLLPRLGVPPHELADDVVELVEALDLLLGVKTPVLLSIGSGARARFTKAERVR